MRLYKSTGCQVVLIGYLQTIADIQTHILVERKCLRSADNNLSQEEVDLYSVRVSDVDITRIIKFGYAGMLLSVTGDLRTALNDMDQTMEIIAEKIDFLHIPKSGKFLHLAEEWLFHRENVEEFVYPTGYQPSLYMNAMRNIH